MYNEGLVVQMYDEELFVRDVTRVNGGEIPKEDPDTGCFNVVFSSYIHKTVLMTMSCDYFC